MLLDRQRVGERAAGRDRLRRRRLGQQQVGAVAEARDERVAAAAAIDALERAHDREAGRGGRVGRGHVRGAREVGVACRVGRHAERARPVDHATEVGRVDERRAGGVHLGDELADEVEPGRDRVHEREVLRSRRRRRRESRPGCRRRRRWRTRSRCRPGRSRTGARRCRPATCRTWPRTRPGPR